MPEYEIDVSATIVVEFDHKPSESEIIERFRRDPDILLFTIQVDYIEDEKGEEQEIK